MSSKFKVVSNKFQIKRLAVFIKLFITYSLLLIPYFSKAAAPVYFKTISKPSLQLFINTTNDVFLLQKGMLERYNSDGTFSELWQYLYQ
jgi:hypothetical protein